MPYLICDHLRLADLQRQDTRRGFASGTDSHWEAAL